MSLPSSSQVSDGEKSLKRNLKDSNNNKETLGTPPANFNFWTIRSKKEDTHAAKKLKLEEGGDEKNLGIKGLDLNRKHPLNLIIVGRRAVTFNKDSRRYFLKFTARDEDGNEISLLVFDSTRFQECGNMMQIEDMVRISNYSLEMVSPEGQKYEPSKFQIRIHSKTLIEASSEKIVTSFRMFAKIKEVKTLEEGKSYDILGIVVYISGIEQFESKCRRILVLTDEVDQNIEVHLWNQEALQFSGVFSDHVAILKGSSKKHNGCLILTATSNTTIWVTPSEDKVPEVKNLLEWFAVAMSEKEKAEKQLENIEGSGDICEENI